MKALPAPVIFYLKHREQIEEWRNLEKEASKLRHKFFSSVGKRFPDVAASLAGGATPFTRLQGGNPKLFLVKPEWHIEPEGPPRIAIGMEWPKNSADFGEVYCGVWVDNDHDEEKRLFGAAKETLEPVRNEHELLNDKTWWLAWQLIKPDAKDFWDHLDQFEEQLIEAIETRWVQCHGLVDKALGAV
jgi:hypothetical protein